MIHMLLSMGPGLPLIGFQSRLDIGNNTALEMVYRLNVGGSFISPMKDSGMFRSWYDDDKYVVRYGALPVNTSIHINYKNFQPYTAPEDVYRTARSMGNNKTENEGFNLTWMLPVDSGFKYMVRLHFCDFQQEIKKTADRSFQVFITNQTAEKVDIILLRIFRDYVVSVEREGGQDRQDLFIALHPAAESETRYSDAIICGLLVTNRATFNFVLF
uniref:Putative receptor-like protein kinase FERONIA n=1 Tax=Davidia involucrata TaxID=16924 RepID=A0A5B7BFZ9_DAVIN